MKGGSNVFRGVLLLARGRPDGIAEFSDNIHGLYASLGPLIAFPLVGAGILAFNGQPLFAAASFLSRLSVVLALSALIHGFAQLTKREPLWLRTATALNWSFWLMVPLLLIAAIIGAVLVTAGVPELNAEAIMIGVLAGYMLWYNWFTIRCGLRLSGLKSFGIMLATNAILGVLSVGPQLLDQLFSHR